MVYQIKMRTRKCNPEWPLVALEWLRGIILVLLLFALCGTIMYLAMYYHPENWSQNDIISAQIFPLSFFGLIIPFLISHIAFIDLGGE